MKSLFEEAMGIFEKEDFQQARLLFGQLASQASLSLDERFATYYLLSFLLIQAGEFQQARLYLKFLHQQKINTRLLPIKLQKLTLMDMLCSKVIEVIKSHASAEIDLSGCLLTGHAFKKIVAALNEQPTLNCIRFSDNPLSEDEVKDLLNFYLTRAHLKEIDLRGLSLNREAVSKLNQLVAKFNDEKPLSDQDAVQIKLSHYPTSADATALLRTLARATKRPITIEIDGKPPTLLASRAISHEAYLTQKALFNDKPNEIATFLTNLLEQDVSKATVQDTRGNIIAYVANVDGHLVVYVLDGQHFKLSMIHPVFPCQSLFIHAPGALVDFDADMSVTNAVHVISDACQLSTKGNVQTKEFIVQCDNKVVFGGKIQSNHTKADAPLLVMLESATLSPLRDEASSITLMGNHLLLSGGMLEAKHVSIESTSSYHLPAALRIIASTTQLKSDEDIILSNAIQSDDCTVTGLNHIEIKKGATLTGTRYTLSARQVCAEGQLQCEVFEGHADDSLLLHSNAITKAKHVQLFAREIVTKGYVECISFSTQGDIVELGGSLIQKNTGSKLCGLRVESHALKLDGKIDTADPFSFNVNKLFASSRSKIGIDPAQNNRKDSQYISSILCKEKCYLEKGSEIHTAYPLKFETKGLSLYGLLHSTQSIQAEIHGSGEIHDSGRMESGRHILFEGSRCWNSGEVQAKDDLNVAFDRFFINGLTLDSDPIDKFKQGKLLGKLSGKNVTISTGFFLGLLSNITAENSVQINSLMELYIGLTNAKFINRSNIIGINLGVNITALKSIKAVIDFVRQLASAAVSSDKHMMDVVQDYYKTTDRNTMVMTGVSYALQIAGIAAKLLAIFAPQFGVPANLILTSINLLFQLAMNGVTVKQEVSKLIDRYKRGQAIHARHIYPLILGIKNIAMTGANMVSMGMGMPSSFSHIPTVKPSHESLLSLAPNLLGLVGGSVSEQSVIQIDGIGATISGLSSSTSAFHVSGLFNNVSAVQFDNSLFSHSEWSNIVAAVRTVNVKDVHELNGYQCVDSETILANKAELGGNTYAHHLMANVHDLTQSGILHAEQGILNTHDSTFNGKVSQGSGLLIADHLKTEEKADVHFTRTSLDIHEAHFKGGQTHLQESSGKIGQLTQDNTASLHLSQGTVMDTGDTQLAGKLMMQDSLLSAQAIDHQKGSVLMAERSGELAEKITYQGQGELVSHATASKETIFSGDYDVKEGYFKGNRFVFEKGSHVGLKDNSVVEATSIQQETEFTLVIDQAGFKGKDIEIKGLVHVDQLFDVNSEQHITIADTAHIEKGHQSHVQLSAPELDNHGLLEAESLRFEGNLSNQEVNHLGTAKNIHTNQLTVVTTQDVVLTQALTSADDIAVVGKSVKNDAVQRLHSLSLESTSGNVEIDKQVITVEGTYVDAARKAIIHDSIKGHQVYIEGHTGIDIEKKDLPVPTTSHHYGGYLGGSRQYNTPYTHKPMPRTVAHQTLTVEGDIVDLESGRAINIKGADVDGREHLQLVAKGNILFDINRDKHARPSPYSHAVVMRTHLTGQDILIKGANLTNNGQTVLGKETWIFLDNDLYNQNQGMIGGSQLLYIGAKNVYNRCQVQTIQGEYGPVETYLPSYLLGGDGSNEEMEGIGLMIDASERIINDASNILSKASNVLSAKWGFSFEAHASTYTAYKKENHSCLGLNNKSTEITETNVGRSTVASSNGQNILISDWGYLTATATDFSAQKGTVVSTYFNAEFYDVVASREVKQDSHTLGIFYTHEKSHDDYASPTVIQDQTGITVISHYDVNMRGTDVLTPGHYAVQAKNYKMSASKLEHTYERSSFGMSATLFNQAFLKTNNPCDFSQPLWCGDPTVNQLQQLANSHGLAEVMLNSWSTTINLVNTTNALINGLRTGTVLTELVKREVPSIFAPQLGINLTMTQTHASSESLGESAIVVGSADFQVDNTVLIKDTPMQVAGDLDATCQQLIFEGNQLQAEVEQRCENLNVTISSMGDPYQVGFSTNHTKTTATTQANEHVYIGGTFTANATDLTLKGAVVDANKLEGHVDYLNNITYADETTCKSESYGARAGIFVLANRNQKAA